MAIVKMSTELIGAMTLAIDWNKKYGAKVFADSSAALGVVHRKGAGKLRHIRVHMLWVQDARESGQLEYNKVGGLHNPGDLMSRHLMQQHLEKLGVQLRDGRTKASLELSRVTVHSPGEAEPQWAP